MQARLSPRVAPQAPGIVAICAVHSACVAGSTVISPLQVTVNGAKPVDYRQNANRWDAVRPLIGMPSWRPNGPPSRSVASAATELHPGS